MSQSIIPTVIRHDYNGFEVLQRADGFWNATAMCRATGKRWNDYWGVGPTQEFLKALSAITATTVIALVQSKPGRPDLGGGTWVHQRVAIHLAQWCDPVFAVHVTLWIEELLTKGTVSIEKPAHAHPWLARIEKYILPLKKQIDAKHPGWWAVGTMMMTEAIIIEEAMENVRVPLTITDMIDNSGGKRYATYREGKPWALPRLQDCHMPTGNRHGYCYPFVYDPREAVHFTEWKMNQYIPHDLPLYIESKVGRDREKWEEAKLYIPELRAIGQAIRTVSGRITDQPVTLPKRLLPFTPQQLKFVPPEKVKQAELF